MGAQARAAEMRSKKAQFYSKEGLEVEC